GRLLATRSSGHPPGIGIRGRQVSTIEGTRTADRRNPQRRRTANAGAWPGADEPAEISDDGRTLAGHRAVARENNFRKNNRDHPRAWYYDSARGTKCQSCPGNFKLRIRPRNRPDHPVGHLGGAPAESPGQARVSRRNLIYET